jgi:hypothetical protein
MDRRGGTPVTRCTDMGSSLLCSRFSNTNPITTSLLLTISIASSSRRRGRRYAKRTGVVGAGLTHSARRLSCRLEQLDRITIRVLHLDLAAA